ncbi:TIGR02206 family membrane protein [Paenibacillus sp. JX-17]|uniref:TIGR02206 family membrane protein n=1 Tax=Paenibacillus lacisoli TaxID=3064525 RepID=A0ABT9CD16_9BACL|nr:TIGR02206 family membrane protein [Paenibacillus sp. JX-17]MDO7907126.1 TIGR02206 family membrane protein [Paenibacillus sp. JX-17]
MSPSWLDPFDPAVFTAFSASHWTAAAIVLLTAMLLYLGRKQLAHHHRARLTVRYGLLVLLVVSEVTLDVWYVHGGVWDARTTLPLELCSVSLVLAAVLLLTRSRLLYQIVLFAGFMGALQAVLTPNLSYAFPHYRFLQFFAAHGAIILTPLYMTWVEGFRPTWRSVGIAMVFLNLLALAVGMVDALIGANYMFLMGKPSTPSVLDWFGPYPYYIAAEEVLAFGLFSLMYGLFFVRKREVKKETEPAEASEQSLNSPAPELIPDPPG